MKTVGQLRKLHHRGGERVDWTFTFTAALYNIVRLRTLLAEAADDRSRRSRRAARTPSAIAMPEVRSLKPTSSTAC